MKTIATRARRNFNLGQIKKEKHNLTQKEHKIKFQYRTQLTN